MKWKYPESRGVYKYRSVWYHVCIDVLTLMVGITLIRRENMTRVVHGKQGKDIQCEVCGYFVVKIVKETGREDCSQCGTTVRYQRTTDLSKKFKKVIFKV